MDKLVERLVEMDAKATKGPWGFYENGLDAGIVSGHLGTRKVTWDQFLAGGGPSILLGGESNEGAIFDDDVNAQVVVSLRNALPALVEYVTAEECLHYIASRSYDSEVWSFRDAGEYEAASVRLSAARAALLSALGGDAALAPQPEVKGEQP